MAKYTLHRAISDYTSELKFYKDLKENGTDNISANSAGVEIADGRNMVPITEVIKDWSDKLDELKTGMVDPEHYNY